MIHLHGFSYYSMQQGLASPQEIINKVKQLGEEAVSITDFNSGYGLIEFYKKANDIKPILGAHMLYSNDGKIFMGIVLLAQNYEGYKNLIKLISIANTNNFKTIPYLKIDDIKKYSDNIIAISSGEGEIEKMILSNEPDNIILDKISELEKIFNGNFYLEFLTKPFQEFTDRQKIETKFKTFIDKNGKRGVVTSFYKYLNKEDKSTYDVLLCIKNNWKFYDTKRPKVKGDYYLMSELEVREILSKNNYNKKFQDYLINQTHNIADSINIKIPLNQILFPNYVVPEKYKKLFEVMNKNKIM